MALKTTRAKSAKAPSNSVATLGPALADQNEVLALITGTHANPFAFLGPHLDDGTREITVRCFLPAADAVTLVCEGQKLSIPMTKVHPDGLFVAQIAQSKKQALSYHYLATWDGEIVRLEDPYRFAGVLSTKEILRFRQGQLWRLGNVLAHAGSLWIRSRALPLPSGPLPPNGCRWLDRSIIGMDVATSCASSMMPVSGRFSSQAFLPMTSINMRSSAQMAIFSP